MCGIAGLVDFKNQTTLSNLKLMTDAMLHRGPDGSGYEFFKTDAYQIGLGQRRLAIIDLSEGGRQPMFYKEYVIVFNGEIYNYKEIKAFLLEKGRTFTSASDTEVILQAFDEWGTTAVNRFIGMFSFVIYNKKKANMTFVRDRPGVKPMHYYWDGELFLFASEIKCFHQHPRFKKELDVVHLRSYLQYGYVPSPNSIFKRVKKQKPGTIITLDLASKELEESVYWAVDDFYEKGKLDISFEEAKVKTKDILIDACKYRLIADVPVGVFLSGGYDSSLVASVLQNTVSEKINTFTIGVKDPALNEAAFAKEVAKYLGTNHTEIYCEADEMLGLIELLPYYYDEPFGDSSAIPTMLVSQIASRHVKVALSADGGDEVFGGYNRYDYMTKLSRMQILKKIPLPYSSITNALLKKTLNKYKLNELFKDTSPEKFADTLNFCFTSNDLEDLFKVNSNRVNKDDLIRNEAIEGNLSRMMAYDYKTYLLDDILTKVDRATMSMSLEGRDPLLDHNIVEFAAQLPETFKINKRVKKYILREIVHEYIPRQLMERPKRGFAVPIFHWMRTALKTKIDYYLSKEFIHIQNLFDFEKLLILKDNILSGKDKHYQKLWYILVFQMWYEKWFINEK